MEKDRSIAEDWWKTRTYEFLCSKNGLPELLYRANEVNRLSKEGVFDDHYIYCLIGLLWRVREMYGDLRNFCIKHKDIIDAGTHDYNHVLKVRVEEGDE